MVYAPQVPGPPVFCRDAGLPVTMYLQAVVLPAPALMPKVHVQDLSPLSQTRFMDSMVHWGEEAIMETLLAGAAMVGEAAMMAARRAVVVNFMVKTASRFFEDGLV